MEKQAVYPWHAWVPLAEQLSVDTLSRQSAESTLECSTPRVFAMGVANAKVCPLGNVFNCL